MGPDGEADIIDRMHRDGLVSVESSGVEITRRGRITMHGAWGDACPEHRWAS
jgi:hypothetical protein